MPEFLHDRDDFPGLLTLVSGNIGITPALVEKDYWIMHCLWGLKQQRFQFELKGGTSLSKGFSLINRFSEDIDIRFEPRPELKVKYGKNHDKPAHAESRKEFYDLLAGQIKISGVTTARDTEYDDKLFRNGGIRLNYDTKTAELEGLKPGILLEVGFDDTTPNTSVDISSWAYEAARASRVDIIDNRAIGTLCYNPEYTFVEKLQTISTKYRKFRASGEFPSNFLRHYYDVYCLLDDPAIQNFIDTPKYEKRKEQRFRTGDEKCITKNPAFLFDNTSENEIFEKEYKKTEALYYDGQPLFAEITSRIKKYIDKL